MDDKVKKKLDKDEKELHSQMEKTFSLVGEVLQELLLAF
jgi:hypothetical protein